MLGIFNSGGPEVRTRRRVYYRTKDGLADYQFEFVGYSDGTWRIYILDQPSYCGRDEGAHPTHRLRDGDRRYVCWTHELRSLSDAQRIAALWANKTQRYIRFGIDFSVEGE